jgi:lipopolysaccharide transport system ATP-binding protein
MSSSDVAISIRGLSKAYTIAHDGLRSPSFREAVVERVKHPFRKPRTETFWAVKDVSFDVKKGDVVGIIGRNGAGKSTLLKILSRIVEPTEGAVDMHGRVGSLLEVGTGFHPELTGRENIFLNGAVLGMRRHEIRRQFDEIVEFAEVEKFLDTPVKRYSSGMYVRLAFAVAAHLNPEILIVDEVLAVGDAQFQKKCLGKMKEVSEGEGRTVLFVSHNMAAVQGLCNRGVMLASGKLHLDGAVPQIVNEYGRSMRSDTTQNIADRKDRTGRGRARFSQLWLEDESGEQVRGGRSGQSLVVAMEYKSTLPVLTAPRASVAVSDSAGTVLFLCSTELTGMDASAWPGAGVLRCLIPDLPLSGSDYLLTAYLEVAGVTEDCINTAASLSVEDNDFYGFGKLYPPGWQGKGVLVHHTWSVTGTQVGAERVERSAAI